MESWEIITAILGAVTIITGGAVKIFSPQPQAPKKLSEERVRRSSEGSVVKTLSVRDIERLTRLEEQVKGHSRELGEVKGNLEKQTDKVSQLSDLLIEWLRSTGRPSR